MHNRVLLPAGVDQIPNNFAGTYQFCLRFPSDYELGLSAETSLANVKNNIARHLSNFHNLNSHPPMTGAISDRRGAHIRNKLVVTASAEKSSPVDFAALLHDFKTTVQIMEVTRVLRESVFVASPLYIGIAKKQSLRERVEQHLDGKTRFSRELHKANLRWENICLKYTVITEKEHLRLIEKISQNLLKPTMSLN